MSVPEADLLARMDWLIGAAPGEDEGLPLFEECDGCMCPLGRPPCHHCVEAHRR